MRQNRALISQGKICTGDINDSYQMETKDIIDINAMLSKIKTMRKRSKLNLHRNMFTFIGRQGIHVVEEANALNKQKLKVKMEKDLESLWNNYKNNERKRKMQSGEECSQDAAMPNVSMSCFICDP
ncbi:hypothetical protein Tco_0575021 [Tanacetum coccineum]